MNSFAELVKEAFIKPLRSVLIVDDQYPTWEEIFCTRLKDDTQDTIEGSGAKTKRWCSEPHGPFDVIKKFRKLKPGFVIDIHDALVSETHEGEGETAQQLADHLHQSDLLVLDYNLEGSSTGTGGKLARDILHSVLSNQHFNLIIVHTDESDLQDVAETCLTSLMDSCSLKYSEDDQRAIDEAEVFIVNFEDSDDFDRNKIGEVFSRSHYLYCRKIGYSKAVGEYLKDNGCLAPLHQLSETLDLNIHQKKSFLLWAIDFLDRQIFRDVAPKMLKGLEWSFKEHTKWIRTARGFVCFINKDITNLLEELEKALIDWKPTPSRLLSAKYRYELNRVGVDAEDDALLKKHLFALFYRDIRNGGRGEILDEQKNMFRIQKLREHVTRQSEGLSFLIEDNVVNFGKEIIRIDLEGNNNFLAHYEVNLDNATENKKAIAQYNNYVSMLPAKSGVSEQLDSGHIFRIDDQWWVCATPACDLQPGQKSIAFAGKSPELRPFVAFQLIKKNPESLSSSQINGGSYCFVEDNGQIIALNIKSIEDEQQPSNLKVHWQTFVAESGGMVINSQLNIKQFVIQGADVVAEQRLALVVCKLRYPYALNYIQRVGISTSRIGLEYVSTPEM